MEHEREVIQLEEFLGSIAGMYDLIMYFIFFMFGQYIDFIARVKWIKALYVFKDAPNFTQKKDDSSDEKEGGQVENEEF
jgi:hypothetical protein